ncbi:hypothetical protein HYE68_005255 [Fusarium pseudograminearum]|nr:hypothetical protein HYE68_005255 [Fusarium pseudograminearum]
MRLNFVIGCMERTCGEENPVSSTPPTSYYDNASSPSSLKGVVPIAAAPQHPAKKAFPGAPLMPGVAGKPQNHHGKSDMDNETVERAESVEVVDYSLAVKKVSVDTPEGSSVELDCFV